MTETLVTCRQLGRTYYRGLERLTALTGASLTVQTADRIALVGPSGGGKSTLLQIMAGLDVQSEGEIDWPAFGVNDRAALRPHKIGYVFQTQSLLAPLTVAENVELPLLMGGGSEKEARPRTLEMLEQLDLASLASKFPEELSGGQAQRVAIARAFVTHPKLILADEPTGQLDHPTAQHLFDVLLELLQASGTAIVVATHDMAIAERMPMQWQMTHGHLTGAA
jgi:putative ABC transport system ATP-binding protein/lipoprotein-releasing system ATP-binding protein